MEDIGLSRAETMSFLTDVLKLYPKEPFEANITTLNTIIRAFMEVIPFQSISLISQDLQDRHVPTWPEVKEAIFKKHGGLCHSMNGFMYSLLKSLEYDVILGAATVTFSPDPDIDDHVVVFVRNLVKRGDLYLVDVGFGCPAFEAINLDFEIESPDYKNAYLEYKFFKTDGIIFKAHGKGDIRFEKEVEAWETVFGKWRSAYWFDKKNLRRFSEFGTFYHKSYTLIDGLNFHRNLRAVAFPQGKMFAITNESKLIETTDGNVEKTHLSNDEEIILTYRTHFPQFDDALVRRAVAIWREQQKQ